MTQDPTDSEVMEARHAVAASATVLSTEVFKTRSLYRSAPAFVRRSCALNEQDVNREYESSIRDLERVLGSDVHDAVEQLDELVGTCGPAPASRTFDDPWWSEPRPSSGRPALVRIGQRVSGSSSVPVSVPAMVPALVSNVVFAADTSRHQEAIAALQGLLVRVLASTTPSKLRFVFIDPDGMGHNAAPFLPLGDYGSELIGGQVWSDIRMIDEQLGLLGEHVATTVSAYLRGTYASIEEYNEVAGEIGEAYRVVVLFGLPANCPPSVFERLVTLARSGPACGVSVVAALDRSRALPHWMSLDDLSVHSETLVLPEDGPIAWSLDAPVGEAPRAPIRGHLELDAAPSPQLVARVIDVVGPAAKRATGRTVGLDRVLRDANTEGSTAHGISIPVGMSGTRVQDFFVGDNPVHALVVGRTGSGKTSLLHTLIHAAAAAYSPEELELLLVDMKEGVEFNEYVPSEDDPGLANVRVVAVESDREFALSTLEHLVEVMRERGALFKGAPDGGARSLADWRQHTNEPLARILLVLDEFHVLLSDDDAIAVKAWDHLDYIARDGRSFGVHVVLASQSLGGLAGAPASRRRVIFDQMALRIALMCSSEDSQIIFGERNDAAKALEKPGEAIYNDKAGAVEANAPFHVAFASADARRAAREQICAHRPPTTPPIMFRGDRLADLDANPFYRDLCDGATHPGRLRKAWLGRPVAIAEDVAVPFWPEDGRQLAVIGSGEDAAFGVLTAAALSLAAQHDESSPARFECWDLASQTSEFARVPSALAELLERRGFETAVSRRAELAESLQRLASFVETPDGTSTYVLAFGLHRARLRASLGAKPGDADPASLLARIADTGPDAGVHLLAWFDTKTAVDQALGRSGLDRFGVRVALSMLADQSYEVLGQRAGPVTRLRGLLFDQEEPNELIKFIPYAVPAPLLTQGGE